MARDTKPRSEPDDDAGYREPDDEPTGGEPEPDDVPRAARPTAATVPPPADRPAKGPPVRRDAVSMDELFGEGKKPRLTKKAKAHLDTYKGVNRSRLIDACFRGIAKDACKKFGHSSVFIGDESNRLVVGIPTPSLSFEFLIANDVFPLGLVYQLVSETGIGKSALVAELGRWFYMAQGGGMFLNEVETKFNPIWYRSILGPELWNRTPINHCNSLEDWQRHLKFDVNSMKTFMVGTKDEPGPGRTFPVLYAVDSVMGKTSEEVQEKIFGARMKQGLRGKTGAGAAERSHPVEALKNTVYLKVAPGEIENWPFAIVLVNHLKYGRDDKGNQERRKAGGVHISFQESFELELTRLGGAKKKISCADYEGYRVALTCFKNSFGAGGRRIVTRLLWWAERDYDSGKFEQRTVWDWDWSTIHTLDSQMNGEFAEPFLKAALRGCGFHLECPERGDIDNLAWSKNLGMKRKDALPWAEVGAMIRADEALKQRLRVALMIHHRSVLAGDYMQQLNQAADAMI